MSLAFAAPVSLANVRQGTARVSRTTASRVTMATGKSASMPFLKSADHLNPDLPGYADFDPLGLARQGIPLEWMQEAEIKHGRVCMVAAIGLLVQEFVHLPNEMYANPVGVEAWYQVPSTGLWHIFLFIGFLEVIMYKTNMSYPEMFANGRTPGDFGFNPLGGLWTDSMDEMKTKEIKNGRLAMVGVGGMLHSMFLFKQPIISQLIGFFS